MIQSTGVFLSAADLTAWYQVRYKKHLLEGILALRDETSDLPVLKEWKSAKAFLARFKAAAVHFLDGKPATLGKVWIEQLPGMCGTPWTIEEDDYAQAHIRCRIALIPAPDAWTLSGTDRAILAPGLVNVVEHRVLHSEINLSAYPRTHLIVDVVRADEG